MKSRGFTLVELLIYMGILALFLGVLTSLFGTIIDVQLETQSYSSVDQDGRFILSRLTYDLQRAQNIVTPATLGGQSANLALSIDGATHTYNVNNADLQITNDSGVNTLNSFDSTVSNVSFKRLGNVNGKNSIQAQYTVSSKTTKNAQAEIKTFQTTIGTR